MCAHYKYTKGRYSKLVNTVELKTAAEDHKSWGQPYQPPGTSSADVGSPSAPLASGGSSGPSKGGGGSAPPEPKPETKDNPTIDLIEVFTGREAEILIMKDGKRTVVPSAYGLKPNFIPRGKSKPSQLYNCRDDSLKPNPSEGRYGPKPSFSEAFYQRRCIVAVDIICESVPGGWLDITPKGEECFFVAGLFNDPHQFSKSITHCLVTTDPNGAIEPHFDRMPVVLRDRDIDLWLDPETPEEVLLSLLRPCPSEWIDKIQFRKRDPSKKKKGEEYGLDFD